MTTSRRGSDAADSSKETGPRILKKYPNRRLYDTRTSSYITLADVKQMVLGSEIFEVRDAKTGEDLTRSILLQIILEEESGGFPIFSTQMLAQLIRFYGHTMQGVMGNYLETNLQTFVDLQKRFTEHTGGIYEASPLSPEAWSQFLAGQTPVVQGLMSTYVDQSKTLLAQMQEQVLKQAGSFFPAVPGFVPPPTTKRQD
jgi:polyhydroxyalkanoate synthesis repressor PhaR